MRVVVVNHYGTTPNHVGAVRHFDLCRHLASAGHTVEFWMCGYNHHEGMWDGELLGNRMSVTPVDGIAVRRFWAPSYKHKGSLAREVNIAWFGVASAAYLAMTRDRPDAVVLSTPPLSCSLSVVARLRHVPLLLDVEDLWPLFLSDMGLRNPIALGAMRAMERHLYATAQAIDAVSNSMAAYIERVSGRQVVVFPLGVDLASYHGVHMSDDGAVDVPEHHGIVVMYCGAHNPANDLWTVLGAAAILADTPGLEFIFYGDGGDRESLQSWAADRHMTHVRFMGPVASTDVPKVLDQADICVTHLKAVPSFRMVRPNKLFEYMAMGKPMIWGIEGESASIVHEAKAGLTVPSEDSAAMAAAIMSLYGNAHLRELLGRNGRTYVEKYGDRWAIGEAFVRWVETSGRSGDALSGGSV